jgi:hypothetical protein
MFFRQEFTMWKIKQIIVNTISNIRDQLKYTTLYMLVLYWTASFFQFSRAILIRELVCSRTRIKGIF